MERFYALWIPQTKRGIPEVLSESFEEYDHTDSVNKEHFYLGGYIDKNTFAIRLEYHFQKAESVKELDFTLERKTSEGFLIYRLGLPDANRDYLEDKLSTTMDNAIYHDIKSFFHRHIYHSSSEDSLLTAYVSESPIDWNQASQRQLIVQNYIQNYKNSFNGLLDNIFIVRCLVQDKLNANRQIRAVRMLPQTLIKNYSVIPTFLYCDFLLTVFPTEISKTDKDEIRQLFATFKKENDTIQFLYDQYNSILSLTYGESGLKWGVAGSIIGIISILLTLGLEIYHTCQPDAIDEIHTQVEKAINKTQEETIKTNGRH